jgi:hypothetical protein
MEKVLTFKDLPYKSCFLTEKKNLDKVLAGQYSCLQVKRFVIPALD